MTGIALMTDDLFRIIRGVVYAEKKILHHCSDMFGEEVTLTPEDRLSADPLGFRTEEIPIVADAVAGFFTLGADIADRLRESDMLGDWSAILAHAWGNRKECITFHTSGSTGEPKAIRRDYCFLEQDASFLASLHPEIQRVVSLVPCHHIYGLIYTVMIPRLRGIPCIDARFSTSRRLLALLQPQDLVVATPFHWKQFAQSGVTLPAGVEGVTSTAPCPADVIRSVRANGLAVMAEIYGSSESGAMGWRLSPDAPYTLIPAWIKQDNETFVRRFPDGTLSPTFTFQDTLEWIDERQFRVMKRLDQAVQVAGINLYPERIAGIIREYPGVAEAEVRLMRPDEGDRLKAFIVMDGGKIPDPEEVRALSVFLGERLNHLEVPKRIRFGKTLPLNEMGKLTDWNAEDNT